MYANESDVKNTIQEFIILCDYIETEKPFSTQKGDLGTKACYAVNQLLVNGKKDSKSTDRLYHYPSVSLWFAIAREAGFIAEFDAKRSKTFYNVTDKYEYFKNMDIFSQYLLLFQIWYCFVDIEVHYAERGMRMITSMLLDSVFSDLCKNGSDVWIMRDKNQTRGFGENMIPHLFEYSYKVTHDLMNFGLLTFEESGEKARYFNHPTLSKIKPTPFGLLIMQACETRKYSEYNVCAGLIDFFEEDIEEIVEEEKEPFLIAFLDIFPNNSINISNINKLVYEYQPEDGADDMRIFEFKVSLGKKCYRVIQCLPHHTFDDLHNEIQEAFNFDNDHLYSFYLNGELYSPYAVHSPYAQLHPSSAKTLLSGTRLRDKQRILYHFDYGDDWMFDIVVGVTEPESEKLQFKKPKTIESVGEAPEQYARYRYGSED
ncbi:MAG: plasmid pRiA4b ORF-3 family protein [Defluviitaleaceae bacterium]|nr:plasmid pRiA4b ORF-3 family protein [Defluviitaleaceae bacterium]